MKKQDQLWRIAEWSQDTEWGDGGKYQINEIRFILGAKKPKPTPNNTLSFSETDTVMNSDSITAAENLQLWAL